MGNRFTSTTRETGAGLTENNPLTVIIPVAGMGYRMKSYGPKCLLKANQQQTILQKTIKNIESEYPFSDIIVVAGFEADKIINALPHKIRVVENQNYEDTNIVESIRLGINASKHENALIIYGDLIFNVYSIRKVTREGTCVVVDSKSRFKEEEVGVTIAQGHATVFAYGLEDKWCQIAFFQKQDFLELKKLCSDKKKNKLYPFEIFNIMITNGCKIKAIEPKGMLIKEIDSLKDLG